MGFPRQEYWSGLPFSPSGDLPNLGIEFVSPVWQEDFFFFLTTEPLWSPWETLGYIIFKISFSFRVACFCECTKSHWIIHFKRKEFSPNCYIKIFSWLLNFQNCDYLAFLLFTIYFLFLVGKTHIPVCPIDILYRKGHSVLGKVFTFLIMASICSSHLNLCGY